MILHVKKFKGKFKGSRLVDRWYTFSVFSKEWKTGVSSYNRSEIEIQTYIKEKISEFLGYPNDLTINFE